MSRLINPDEQFFDNDTGAPLALGTLYFGEPNQDPETNPKAVYSDAALTTAISPTQSLTADGKPAQFIYLKGEYSLTVRDAAGALIFNLDSVNQDIVDIEQKISQRAIYVGSVAELVLVSSPIDHGEYSVTGFFSGSGVGGGMFYYDSTLDKSNHNGVTVFDPDKTFPNFSVPAEVTAWLTADGVGTGCFVRKDVTELNSSWCGLPQSDTDVTLSLVSRIEEIVFADSIDCYFVPGTYDVGNNNFPFRNTATSPLKSYGGARIYGDRSRTIFKTTSNDGADVLQLNAVQGLTIDDIKITAVLTATGGSGSNGVSVTNGGKDLYIDVECEDLPYVDAGSFMDGGKAFTLQPGTTSNPIENIKGRIVARNCGYGFGADINNDNTINSPIKNVNVVLFCDTSYRGVVLSGTANTTTVPSNGLDWGITVEAVTINCQQHYISNRAWGVNAKVKAINTTSSLAGYLAGDTERYVTSVLGSKNETLDVTGSVETVDVIHRAGGTTNGGGVSGAIENSSISLAVDYQTTTTQFDLVNSGGNRINLSELSLDYITSFPFSDFFIGSNTLNYRGALKTRDFQNYNTFTHFTSAGVKSFGLRSDGSIESVLTSTSALGAYVGKKAEYDETGAFLGYRPIYA